MALRPGLCSHLNNKNEMSSYKTFFAITIGLLNVYYFVIWTIAFNKFPSQLERVDFFLDQWLFFNFVIALNVTLLLFTIISLIIINIKHIKPIKSQTVRFTLSTIHILFIFFSAWSSL